MMDAVHFHWSRRTLQVYIGFAVLLAAFGLPILLAGDWDALALGGLWIAAFAWLGLALARRLSDRGPVLSAGPSGLFDRRIASAEFGWDEISRIEAYEAENLTWVGLEFHDPGESLRKSGWLVRLVAPLHRLLRFPRVSISMSLLDGTAEDLLAAIRRFRPGLIAET